MMTLTTRSTPFCTPMAQTRQPTPTTMVMPSTCSKGLPSVLPKKDATPVVSRPARLPERLCQQ